MICRAASLEETAGEHVVLMGHDSVIIISSGNTTWTFYRGSQPSYERLHLKRDVSAFLAQRDDTI